MISHDFLLAALCDLLKEDFNDVVLKQGTRHQE